MNCLGHTIDGLAFHFTINSREELLFIRDVFRYYSKNPDHKSPSDPRLNAEDYKTFFDNIIDDWDKVKSKETFKSDSSFMIGTAKW
jgi:hypothetical protein